MSNSLDSYIDLRLMPNATFAMNELLSVVFLKLHLRLVSLKCTSIGLSFPEFRSNGLGSIMRLHGSKDDLDSLMQSNWMNTANDFVVVSEILPVPPDCNYRIVRRVQPQGSFERHRRRSIKRHGQVASETLLQVQEHKRTRFEMPYIEVRSLSNNNVFRFFVSHGELFAAPQMGSFSSYGLSATATIPWF